MTQYYTMLIFLVLTAFILPAKADGDCVCPVITVNTNTTPAAQNEQLLPVINSVLALPLPYTATGTKLMNILRNMTTSPNLLYQQTADFVILFMASQIPLLPTNPSGCIYAQMINATVACLRHHNAKGMLTAINGFSTDLTSLFTLIATTSRIASGCPLPATPATTATPATNATPARLATPAQPAAASAPSSPPSASCYKNGFVYNLWDLWRLKGTTLPHGLYSVVEHLYKSSNYFDNYLALIMTFALTPTINNVSKNWPGPLAFETLVIVLSGPIPACCCESRLKRISELEAAEKQVVNNIIQSETNLYSSPKACMPKYSMWNSYDKFY